MGKGAVVLVWCLVAGCGRLEFDPVDTGSGGTGSGDALPPPGSCEGLAATCGPAGTSSCCGSTLVSGGTFFRGYDVAGDGLHTTMAYPATVSDFRLDTYEVTIGRFRKFVEAGLGTQTNPPEAGAGAHAIIANSGWDPAWNASLEVDSAALSAALVCDPNRAGWTPTPGANESLPIICVTWYEAMAFCAWDGGFLPTDAERAYAGAGGSEQRTYPWSNPPSDSTIDCSYANYEPNGYCVNPPQGSMNRVGAYSPKSDGKWGQADLAGNAWEWVLDSYVNPYVTPCVDCADLSLTTDRAWVSGSYFNLETNLRSAFRFHDVPSNRKYHVGFRCARSASAGQ